MINRKMGLEIQSSQTTTGNVIIFLWVEEEEEIQSADTYNDTGEHY